MVTYSIVARVRPDLVDAYESYMLDRHIPDLLETGMFTGASVSRGGSGEYRIDYFLHGRDEFDRYINEFAPALRAHFAEKFPVGVELDRSVWDEVRIFSNRD